MPKITEVRVRYRHVLQPVQFEPIESEVVITATFGEGEEADASDLETLCDQARAVVDYQLGIETVGSATVEVVEREANPPAPSGQSSGGQHTSSRRRGASAETASTPAEQPSKEPQPETAATTAFPSRGRRGANPRGTTSTASSTEPEPSSTPSEMQPVSGGSSRGRRGASPTQTSAASTSAAPAVTSGSPRRGAGASKASATDAGAAVDYKQSDISKACSELGRKKGHAAVFALLEEFDGATTAAEVKANDFEAFVTRAKELCDAE